MLDQEEEDFTAMVDATLAQIRELTLDSFIEGERDFQTTYEEFISLSIKRYLDEAIYPTKNSN
jgi:hypothetical protein